MQTHPLTTSSTAKLTRKLKQLKLINPVILCIGANSVASDRLGPTVGALINAKMKRPLTVYGMGKCAITAQHLQATYDFVRAMHPCQPLIVVDSAVGGTEQIGKIQLLPYGLHAGKATGKRFQPMGDVSIIGIVANKNMEDFYSNTLAIHQRVDALAHQIAHAIMRAVKL